MKSLLAIILAFTGTLNISTASLFENAPEIASEFSAYELLLEYNIINKTSADDNATYEEVLYTLLNVYSLQNEIELSDDILADSVEYNLISEQDFEIITLSDDINYGQFSNLLCDYLRSVDNFSGATAGVKYNILNFDSIDEQYQYSALSLYSAGIMTNERFYSSDFLTFGESCEYIAKAINFKPKDTVELAENYLPIVMYHSVNDEENDVENNYIISSETFENDLIYLQNHGYTTLFVADLVDILQNNLDFPEKPILLTFDDGYEDNYTNVYRLLSQYDMKGIVAPVTIHYYEYDPEAFPHLTTAQTIEMSISGVIEFANHSYNLHTNNERYGTLRNDDETFEDYQEFLLSDLTKSHNFYIENGISEPIIYAYPYGALDDDSELIMKEFGYLATFDTDPAYLNIISTTDDLYELARLNRPDGLSSEEFFAQLEMLDLK
ncbi:MAG: polysaccharide deacetylase family protein [Clostridia bacterium]